METLRREIDKSQLISRGDTVLCALSGGADSVVLTHALSLMAQKLGITVCAAHYSHGIRPECAQSEKQLCVNLCYQLGIELITGQGDVPKYAKEQGISLEHAARKLRYDFLNQAAQQAEANKIATAHNMGDNTETVLFNLIRGGGTALLCGIPPSRDNLIRPLLTVDRASIEAYARQYNLQFAVDQSNFDNNYSRNKIRNEIIPLLESINPAAQRNVTAASALARQDVQFIEDAVRNVLKNKVSTECRVEIDISHIVNNHSAVATKAVMVMLKSVMGKKQVTFSHVKATIDLCTGEHPSAQVSISGDVVARRQYDLLIVEKKSELKSPEPRRLEVGEQIVWGDYSLQLLLCQDEQGIADIEWPVFVRNRIPGERVCINGHTKKLKKLLIDKKIPNKERDILPIICDNKGVLSICDIAIDSRRIIKNNGERYRIVCRRVKSE